MQLGAPLGAPRTMQMCNPLACFLACFWPKSKANVHFFLAAASVMRKCMRKALTEAKVALTNYSQMGLGMASITRKAWHVSSIIRDTSALHACYVSIILLKTII